MAQSELKWQQIFEALESGIKDGQLRGKLPSYKKLSSQYRTSVITISRVVRELERRGYVLVKPQSGVTVEPALTAAKPIGHNSPLSSSGLIKRIALVSPVALSDPYWARVADGAISACWKRNQVGRSRWRLEVNYSAAPLPNKGYSVKDLETIAQNMSPEAKKRAEELEKSVILDLCEANDGLLIAPRAAFSPDFYQALLRKGTRLLTLDNKVAGVPCVASQNRRAAYKGIAYLLLGIDSSRGRILRRVENARVQKIPFHLVTHAPQIYVIGESLQSNTMNERVVGCQEAIQDAISRGYAAPQNCLRLLQSVKNLSEYQAEAHRATLNIIEGLENMGQLGNATRNSKRGANLPVAIFALTDRCALGAYQALVEKGYAGWTSEKESVALLSYDNLWQSLEAYSISSLAQDPFEMGKSGAEMLFDMPHPSTFFEPAGAVTDVMLEVGLVKRDSTQRIKCLEIA